MTPPHSLDRRDLVPIVSPLPKVTGFTAVVLMTAPTQSIQLPLGPLCRLLGWNDAAAFEMITLVIVVVHHICLRFGLVG